MEGFEVFVTGVALFLAGGGVGFVLGRNKGRSEPRSPTSGSGGAPRNGGTRTNLQ